MQRNIVASFLAGATVSWLVSRLAVRRLSTATQNAAKIDALLAKVGEVHNSPHRVVFTFAGAGSKALSLLHAVGGSSRTLLEAVDTYSQPSLTEFVGKRIDKYVVPETAKLMAERSFERALKLASEGKWPVLGLSCTAAIATDRSKKGLHRCIVGVTDDIGTETYDVILLKGTRTREEEEDVVASVVLHSLCKGAGITPLPLQLNDTETVTHLFFPKRQGDEALVKEIQQLKTRATSLVVVSKEGRISTEPIANAVVLSGSFHPLHKGHTAMLEEAAKQLPDKTPYFELAISNADKGVISTASILKRLDQFKGKHNVVLTTEPLFQDKTHLMKNSVFVVGYDTAVRLVDAKYYGGSNGLTLCMNMIQGNGCRFMVAGRKHKGEFLTLDDIPEARRFSRLFMQLPDFRVDISSTELRQKGQL